MHASSSSFFGATSVSCAIVSLISAIVFFASGIILPSFAQEQAIVITQLISLILIPSFALIGLGFGIAGIMHEIPNGLAKAGTWMNGLLLLLFAIAASFLTIASSTTTAIPDDSTSSLGGVNVEIREELSL